MCSEDLTISREEAFGASMHGNQDISLLTFIPS